AQERDEMSARKGFTLIEILVAMTIFSVVMTAVYAGFNTGVKVWKRGERDMQAFRDARVMLALMSRELRCAFPEAGHLFYGEDKRSGKRSTDRIEFFTVRPPLQPGKGYVPRILKIAYYVKPARGGRGYVLEREEQIVAGRIPAKKQEADKNERQEQIKMERAWRCIIAADVDWLDFQYSWGKEWRPSCRQGFGLPAVVRIALEFQGEGKGAVRRRFDTAVNIPLGPGEEPPRKKGKNDRSRRQKV
ncbi:MAG: prepilin-type N-terminal cleavage/methylation domain-containing protein, partial [Candidatus Hydrogenedentes bacterium]|nr:prepilin-type N-terminal cleavage/methylation domain-containing protein [Candidatus Hydrogenedentota bacterium]